jgi:hypothetical protein
MGMHKKGSTKPDEMVYPVCRMNRRFGAATVFIAASILVSGAARAQAHTDPAGGTAISGSTTAAPPAGPTPARDPWVSPTGGASAPSQPGPQPYAPGYPPPAYPAPYPGAYPYGPGYAPFARYEMDKKNPFLGFAIEFFVPGLGSIYGDHAWGAAITWGLMVGGVAVILSGFKSSRSDYGDSETKVDEGQLVIGLLMVLGGRIYGLVDSVVAARGYNEQLRQRLGIASHFSIEPIRLANGSLTAGPSLRMQF